MRGRRATLFVRSLFQLALFATGFGAWRVMQSPSTQTFFLFESALGTALGIYAYTKLGTRPAASQADVEEAVDASSRRGSLAETGRQEGGNAGPFHPTTYNKPRSMPVLGSRNNDRLRNLGPRTSGTAVQPLLDEGRALLSLARSLGLDTRNYNDQLLRVQMAQREGKAAKAVRLLRRGNERLRARVEDDVDGPESEAHRRRLFFALGTMFFVTLAVGIWTVSRALYVAPAAFYAAAGIAGGVLAMNVYYNGEQRPAALLAQIFLLAVLVKFYFLYLNPYVYSSDIFLWYGGLQEISSSGFVTPALGHYYYFPGFVVFAYEGVATAGIPPSLFGVFPQLAELTLIPAAYLIGRTISTPRGGLFTSLFALFSVYAFLSTLYTPALYSLPFLLLAIYALIRIEARGEVRWLVVFWVAALGTFFSHPVSALVLALVLVVRFLYFRIAAASASRDQAVAGPALSYCVTYGVYVSFLAVTAFATFVQTIFVSTYAPPLATSPGVALQEKSLYVLQSAIAPVSLAILVSFATYGLFPTSDISKHERRFFVVLGAVFVLTPLIEAVTENFRTQSSRFLLYLGIPLFVLAGHGVTSLTRTTRNPRRTAILLAVLFMTFGFLASSTYLTFNDTRFLSTDVPAIPTHITSSALASRNFLALAEENSSVYMDFGSWYYFDNSVRAPNALLGLHTNTLEEFNVQTGQAFVVMNYLFLPYGDPYLGSQYDVSATQTLLEGVHASQLFDAGEVQVYLTP